MKKISKAEILIWALALLPLAGCLVAGPFLPREIPMHWNASGQVDRYEMCIRDRHGRGRRYAHREQNDFRQH